MRSTNQYSILIHLGHVLKQFPEIDLVDALSSGQIESKKWLIHTMEDLQIPLGNIFVLAGWWGMLPAMIFESKLDYKNIRSFDIDPSCAPIADSLNRKYVMEQWKFKATTQDILEINYRTHAYFTKRADGTMAEIIDSPDTLINTSCEHIVDFPAWWEMIPIGKLVALQSNNLKEIPEHVNCSESLDDFIRMAAMSKILYKGEHLVSGYKRFMIIGYK